MTRTIRRTLGALLALALGIPAAPLLAGHGGSHGSGSHGGGSHGGGSHGGGSHGSHGGGSHGSRGGGSHHRGSGGSHGHGSHGHVHTGGDWIFFSAPFWGGLGGWYPDGGPYVEPPPEEYVPEDEGADAENAPAEDSPEDSQGNPNAPEDRPDADLPPAGGSLLTFSVEPEDAAVYLDGHLLGTGEEVARTLRGVPVAPGRHEIAVTSPGLREWTSEIEIVPGESRKIEVSLER